MQLELNHIDSKDIVSVVMSTFNSQDTIYEAILSVLNQTYPWIELIVVNDASTDDTVNILNNIDDERLLVIHSIKNIGLTKSLVIGISKSKGSYIARIDSDDVWISSKIDLQMQYLKNNKLSLLVSNYIDFNVDTGKSVYSDLPLLNSEIKNEAYRSNPFCHSSVIFTREVYDRIGGYDIAYKYSQDYSLWIRILMKHQVGNMKDYFVVRKITPIAISKKNWRAQRYFATKAKLLYLTKTHAGLQKYFSFIKDLIIVFFPFNLTK